MFCHSPGLNARAVFYPRCSAINRALLNLKLFAARSFEYRGHHRLVLYRIKAARRI
jgi:hypothetical protein